MFTGIVEGAGEILRVQPDENHDALFVTVRVPFVDKAIKLGDSIAMNGCCLTVLKVQGTVLTFEVGHETLQKSNLSSLRPRDLVNLERSLKVGDRLDGHVVSGHVDTIGSVQSIQRTESLRVFEIKISSRYRANLIYKGSVSVNGVSLTINHVDGSRFFVGVLPYTLTHTNLRALQVGDAVNVELDMFGKYVLRSIETWRTSRKNHTQQSDDLFIPTEPRGIQP